MMERGRRLVTGLLLNFLLGALAVACAATPTTESTGGYFDDAAITAKVKTALAQDPKIGIRAAQIHIITYKSVVELSGFVDSDAEVAEAGSAAAQVAGVKSVQNNLIVKTQAAPWLRMPAPSRQQRKPISTNTTVVITGVLEPYSQK
jgi:hyperosmotically inducible protein